MVAPHEREVIIRLKLEVDKQQATGAGREIERSLKQVEQQATRAGQNISRAVTKGLDWKPIIRDAQAYGLSIEKLNTYLSAADRASLKLYLTNQRLATSERSITRELEVNLRQRQQAMRDRSREAFINLRQERQVAQEAVRGQQRRQAAMLSVSRSTRRAMRVVAIRVL